MKKSYETATVDIVLLTSEDIQSASLGGYDDEEL